jgi:Na+:H+ antiporter, NhaA family
MVRRSPDMSPRRVLDPLRDFLHSEAAGGVALAVAAAAALVWANSPLADSYYGLWQRELTLGVFPFRITEDLQHWVNDGLMALFFFVVGLEIKRELVTGELRDPRAAALPVVAAVGGVVLPALIFLSLTLGTPAAAGWGIPMATDIAFAVGVLALLGSRIPAGAKLFLLTVAIVDDILAIGVIAVVYTASLSVAWLVAAAAGLLAVVVLRAAGLAAVWPFVPVGIFVWVATLQSGVHATIAGVALGLLTPARPIRGRPVLEQLEHRLHPVSAFVVIPLFALANAGVALSSDTLRAAAGASLAWAIGLGLVAGKVLGIGGGALLALRLRFGVLPDGVGVRQVWGVAALGGIGFTVSLFIAELAYGDPTLTETAKIGIFAGSLLAALLGVAILRSTRRSGQEFGGRVEEIAHG